MKSVVPSVACRGDWIQVHSIVLKPNERTGHIPEDTRAVPFESWVKGFLEEESAAIGDVVRARTTCGRVVSGELVGINPGYTYGFGSQQVQELLGIGVQARQIVMEALP